MRKILGEIVLPSNAPEASAGKIITEIRDTSLMDAPSEVIAVRVTENVEIGPGEHLLFELQVPEVEGGRSLSLRVHISLDGSGRVKEGDFLTTSNIQVPNTGTPDPIEAAVAKI